MASQAGSNAPGQPEKADRRLIERACTDPMEKKKLLYQNVRKSPQSPSKPACHIAFCQPHAKALKLGIYRL